MLKVCERAAITDGRIRFGCAETAEPIWMESRMIRTCFACFYQRHYGAFILLGNDRDFQYMACIQMYYD